MVGESWVRLGDFCGSEMTGPGSDDFSGLDGGDFSASDWRTSDGRVQRLLDWVLKARPAAKGLSTKGADAGSYSCFCSRANMLLFLTREARFKFSIEERLAGEGEPSRGSRFSPFCRVGEVESRFCQ